MDVTEVITGRRRQWGAAIVEATIALPVLIVVILAAVQFGFVYQAKATLNHAALQAARAGAVSNAEHARAGTGGTSATMATRHRTARHGSSVGTCCRKDQGHAPDPRHLFDRR